MPTVLITGANRGIGLEMTRRYASGGATVIATARQPATSDALQAVASETGRVTVLPLEVGNEASVAAMATALAGKPIDILINNAGALGSRGAYDDPAHDLATWTEVLITNVVGPHFVSRALVANLKLAKQPKLAIVCSHLGSSEMAAGGVIPYRASKAAAINLARNLAVELKPLGIAVVAFHPGWVQTDMGGYNAAVKVGDSAQGMIDRLAALSLATSGVFEDYSGKRFPF
jgi:NAD(P)-dependent dehydrogenase (short-subunit alcohol dehydrogenase family)